jgi:hypothetical protein
MLGKGLQPPRSAPLHSPLYVLSAPLCHTPMLTLTAQSLQLIEQLTTAPVGAGGTAARPATRCIAERHGWAVLVRRNRQENVFDNQCRIIDCTANGPMAVFRQVDA